ncbi:MAG: adenine phosphoribosyltransferase [Chloroflexi bacterium]|nr:MAG: adenine phosphoribosyltransferase [Chloroflexota bacterium]
MSEPVTSGTSTPATNTSGITPGTHALTVEQSTWLKQYIRNIPDYPQPGILFRDITPLLQDATALQFTIETMANRYRSLKIDQVVGIESRGFIFGTPLAYLLGTGFVPVRKKGKLPSEVISVEYELEYGSNVLEIHTDSIRPGQRILVVDDLLATGGTTAGTVKLVEQLGAQVVSLAFLIELAGLEGRARLPGQDVFALLSY